LAVGYFFGGAFQMIETWITRIGLFALIAVIFFLVLWFSIKKGEKAWEYTVSFIQSTGWSFVNSYPVRWFYHKFPKTYIFIANRLKKDSFWGMPFTLLSVSLFVTALGLFTITRNVLLSSSVVSLDMKIENLLVVFRDSFLVKFFLCVTALGEAQIIVSVVLIVTALFWLWKKRFYIMSLWITVAGSAISAYIAKILINRERPGGNIPVFTENFFSFPSGHSASIIALLGFLTYCVWRNYKTWRIRVNTFFVASFIIILVGFSRLYLGVHFLSDVLGGYLIGFLWMLLGIAISEWLIIKSHKRGGEQIIAEIRDEKVVNEKHHWLKFFTGILVMSEVFYTASFIISFKPIFNVVDQTAERQILVRDISDPLFEKYIPKFPENLTGDYQTPLNFVVIATDNESFKQSILDIGWLSADSVGLKSFTKIIITYFKNISYDTAPITPLFWHGRPYDFVFQKPITDTNIGVRYKVRFWKTDIMTEDGGYVYVGSTELDKSIEYIILRNVSNELDIARDELFKDMLKGKIISRYEKRPFVDNSRGNYYEKGKYLTDGKAYFIYLK
jgi:membrane-associated phospholipid phosphatase